MSRRTKLLLTALFLVLLAIPVIHTTLTWRPENPLRFTIDQSQAPPPSVSGVLPKRVGSEQNPIYVVVQNTSGTSIALFSGSTGDTPVGGGIPEGFSGHFSASLWPTSLPGVRSEYWLIPPHGTIRCAIYLLPGQGLADLRSKDTTVYYTWCSTAKLRARACWTWLDERTSQLLSRHGWLRDLYPDSGGDFTPLAPAAAIYGDDLKSQIINQKS